MHFFFTCFGKQSLVDGLLEILCSYGGIMTSNSVLYEVGHLLKQVPQRVPSLYGTALTLPIVKWSHFRRYIAFCGISLNYIKVYIENRSFNMLHIPLLHFSGEHPSVPPVFLFLTVSTIVLRFFFFVLKPDL